MASIVDARLQCHHAAQFNTRLARAFVPAREDDSHTSLTWNPREQALVGEPFRVAAGQLRLGLRVRELSLLMFREGLREPARLMLDGLTLSDASKWIEGFGVDAEALSRPIHFELEDHPLLHGAKFLARSNEQAFLELSSAYAQAAALLEEFRTAHNSSLVRCWPHHFDIATLYSKADGSIGVGMSPGDRSYAEPYYYVSPWPYPPVDGLPALGEHGTWHVEGWVGAVLRWEELGGQRDRASVVRSFVSSAFQALR
ncbi:MAG TPA: hypothetical protein VKB79_02165 [Bryobacteraceae bacterium]|nr:hypothetical protein [Bryobacteraceae bacterium]